jgi:hypothetical protein
MIKSIVISLFISLSVVCNCKAASFTADTVHTDTVNIITDNLFANGLDLVGPKSSSPMPIGQLYPFGSTNSKPQWRMLQWATRFNLLGTKPEINNDSVIYKNEGKEVAFLRQGNQVLVKLEVYGSKEYTAPRQAGEAWPHLLLEQKIKPVLLTSFNKIMYSISAKLNYAFNRMGADFNPKLHTCQVTLYLLVQNLNKQSAGYGDFFWFGLPLYDYRYPVLDEYGARDGGKADATQKFILNVASNTLFTGSLQDKQWVSINKDIYPQILAAFNKARQNGYLKTSAITDMSIESINVGWEVPGTFDCSLQFKGLKLTGTIH